MTKDQKLLNDINQMQKKDVDFVRDEIPAEMKINRPAEVKKGLEMIEGNYTLNTMGEQLAYAQYLMDNLLVSDTFKKPSQLVLAVQACKDLGLPNSCLKDFYVIGGRPAIYGDTFLGLMHGAGLLDVYVVKFFDCEGELIVRPKKGQIYFGCEIEARRLGQLTSSFIHYSFDDKELSRSSNPTWNKSPRDMLFRRCAGRVAKWITPDAIRGIELADYAEDINNDRISDKEAAELATQVFSS